MNANLTEKIREAVKIKSLNEIVKKSNDRFKPKLFSEKFLPIYRGTPLIRIIFSLFSILTGISFFLSISGNLNFYFALVLGCSLYILIELLKGKLIKISLTEIFQKQLNIISIFSVLFSVGLFGLSVFCSVKGAETLYQKTDTSKADLKSDYTSKKEILRDKYTFELKELKTAKNNYIQLVSYKGKINIHNSTNKITLANYEKRITDKEAEQKAAFQEIATEEKKSLIVSSKNEKFSTKIWVIISALIEVSILACLVFVSFYEFKTFTESSALEYFDLPSENNNEMKKTFTLKNQAIGFKKNQVETSRNNDYSENRQVLDFMINKGINDFKVLAKLGFNFKQISAAIQNIN
jgi:hypothetical protein